MRHWISAKIPSSFIVTCCQLHCSYGSSRKDYFSLSLLRQTQISVPCGWRVTLVLQPPSNRSSWSPHCLQKKIQYWSFANLSNTFILVVINNYQCLPSLFSFEHSNLPLNVSSQLNSVVLNSSFRPCPSKFGSIS